VAAAPTGSERTQAGRWSSGLGMGAMSDTESVVINVWEPQAAAEKAYKRIGPAQLRIVGAKAVGEPQRSGGEVLCRRQGCADGSSGLQRESSVRRWGVDSQARGARGEGARGEGR
jgi:hypothetical protein